MKFDWNEFMNEDNKIAVHCKTEEEATDFCNKMDEHGMKWMCGDSYFNNSDWNKDYPVYKNYGMHCDMTYCNDYKILEWSDYMENGFTEKDIKLGFIVTTNTDTTYIKCGFTTYVILYGGTPKSIPFEDIIKVEDSYGKILYEKKESEQSKRISELEETIKTAQKQIEELKKNC